MKTNISISARGVRKNKNHRLEADSRFRHCHYVCLIDLFVFFLLGRCYKQNRKGKWHTSLSAYSNIHPGFINSCVLLTTWKGIPAQKLLKKSKNKLLSNIRIFVDPGLRLYTLHHNRFNSRWRGISRQTYNLPKQIQTQAAESDLEDKAISKVVAAPMFFATIKWSRTYIFHDNVLDL